MQDLSAYILTTGGLAFLIIVGSFLRPVLRARYRTLQQRRERTLTDYAIRCVEKDTPPLEVLTSIPRGDSSMNAVANAGLLLHTQRLRDELARGVT